MSNPQDMVNVRYMVDDVPAAIGFLGDIAAEVDRLRAEGVRFRNRIVTGPGGKQILVEDPAGNVVELFEPAATAPAQ